MNNVKLNNISEKITKEAKKIFGKTNIKSIKSIGALYNRKHKIVVFVPLKKADELTFGMASAGAGTIGNYTVCSFRVKGAGTFLGGKGSNPKAGKKGKFEIVEEIRLEMICDRKNLDNVIDKIYEVHPYEEPAYEIYDVTVRSKTASKETAYVKLNKKILVKDVFKKVNGAIDPGNLPAKIRNTKIKQAVIDYSQNETYAATMGNKMLNGNKTIYIKRNKKITNIELK
jgi:hypothetical protein